MKQKVPHKGLRNNLMSYTKQRNYPYKNCTEQIKYEDTRERKHLNGKVERSQQTDKTEFYSLLNLKYKTLHLTGDSLAGKSVISNKDPLLPCKGKALGRIPGS